MIPPLLTGDVEGDEGDVSRFDLSIAASSHEMLFAYLAAVGDGPSSAVDAPDTSTSDEVIVSSFSEAEMGHLSNLAGVFGSLTHEETIKVSTLVLAYVVIV